MVPTQVVNFKVHSTPKVCRFKAGLLQASQELADVFKIRRFVMQLMKGEPTTAVSRLVTHLSLYMMVSLLIPILAICLVGAGREQNEVELIHRYLVNETLVSHMPFWQVLTRAGQLEACKKLKLCKGG